MPISAVDCVHPAVRHVREQLFTRFRWDQWTRLALIGMLAAELHTSGCGSKRIFNPPQPSHPPVFHPPHLDPARIGELLGVIALVVIAVFILGFILLFVNSVFRFILFDSVVRREASIRQGWHRWRAAGGRFFLWQIVFQIVAVLFFAVLIGVPLAMAASAGWISNPREHLRNIAGTVFLLGGVFLFLVLIAASIQVLAKDFLVPIMALEDVDFGEGWRKLLAMIYKEPWSYVAYLVVKIILAIIAAILFGIVAMVPIVILAIPVGSAVLIAKGAGLSWGISTITTAIALGACALIAFLYLLALVTVPATVFFPAYSIYFFADRYPNLRALLNSVAPQPIPSAPPPRASS